MGRKRKANADRYPSGQIKYPAPLPHRQRMVDYARMRDPELGSLVGILFMEKRIDRASYEAALAYRAARERADRLLGLPPRHAKGQDMTGASGAGSGLVDHDGELARKAERRLGDMDEALGIYLAPVQRTVIYDLHWTSHEAFEGLCRGLTRLAAWQRVTGRTSSV